MVSRCVVGFQKREKRLWEEELLAGLMAKIFPILLKSTKLKYVEFRNSGYTKRGKIHHNKTLLNSVRKTKI